ncbi:MAG: UDP-N-acetylmuramoyl-L-alanine--D-glutamate ligase [Acidobacteriaceae bacterium]|nr:UDP-N-acetylmuramoyl-L-alanine--D-glutamate ligase [Acidobacteriaceae bacterium]
MTLQNKKTLVVGLGKSGIAASRFLAEQGAVVTACDAKEQTLDLPGINVQTGAAQWDGLEEQELIVISPGVPVQTAELERARGLGIPVIGEMELASRYLQGQMLAITGANGKTTTTTLVGKILEDAGLHTQVGGNIGTPVMDLVAGSTAATWNVLEVSSFQLETTVEFHPKIAVILNITPDHLDRHGSFEQYVREKEKIFARQGADDFLVLNADDKTTQMCAGRATAQVFWFSGARPQVKRGTFVHKGVVVFVPQEGAAMEPVLAVEEIPLKGAHNVENVLAAVCAARLAGVSAESIRESVKSFQAVEHRLQFVAAVHGVEYYNDSKATNVDATMKAIASFAGGIHLILGGKDKNSDYTLLAPLLRERVKIVYTIGSAAEKITGQLTGVVKIVQAETLAHAVKMIARDALSGEIGLLAPACASFDQFDSYGHRGRVFVELVKQLQQKD